MVLTRDRVADVGQFLLKLGKERLHESKRLAVGTLSQETKKDIEVMLDEAKKLTDAFDMVMLVGKSLP